MLKHIGFIMDGNGRWALSQGMKREEGYRYGLQALMRVAQRASERGVAALTAYAFSTENLARPESEREAIFSVVEGFNRTYEGNFRVLYMGDIDDLPASLADSVEDVERRTATNKGMILNIALNYGGRADIVRAAKLCYDAGEFSEEAFLDHLGSAGLPPLDLIVRTGGEKRLSNFMLYEAAYSELLFLSKYWCDMTEADVDAILDEFELRERKFGR